MMPVTRFRHPVVRRSALANHRWLRFRDRPKEVLVRKSTLIVGLVVATLLVPVAVFAAHSFNDVPDDHTFHDAIAWMKDNGVTVGCNPPANTNYCPDDNVTRGQMAAFMRRLAENQVVDAASVQGATAAELAPIAMVGQDNATSFPANLGFVNIATASVDIAVPEGHSALVVGRFAAESQCVGGDFASVRLLLDGAEMSPVVGTDFAFDSSSETTESSSWESHAMERFQAGVAAGNHTVTAQVSTGCTTFRIDDWTLVAEARLGGSATVAALDLQDEDPQR
jgi:hypothetical protein